MDDISRENNQLNEKKSRLTISGRGGYAASYQKGTSPTGRQPQTHVTCIHINHWVVNAPSNARRPQSTRAKRTTWLKLHNTATGHRLRNRKNAMGGGGGGVKSRTKREPAWPGGKALDCIQRPRGSNPARSLFVCLFHCLTSS